MTHRLPVDRRYLRVAADGRHTTLGRAFEPDEEVLNTAVEALDALGMAGWLVLSEGRYYGEGDISLLPVRRPTSRSSDWETTDRCVVPVM